MRRAFTILLLLVLAGFALFWALTAPQDLSAEQLAGLEQPASNGEEIFWAAGCASCHIAPGAEKSDAPVLTGGQAFASDFGTFYAPNISGDAEHGIGAWTRHEFARALLHGVSPDEQHYYPAFPYTSYAKMTAGDVAALYGFMRTLPADATPSKAHEVPFPFSIRRVLGGWKMLFFKGSWAVDDALSEVETRGRYLSEAMAHCGECHTPRNMLGGFVASKWMGGAPNPNGKGTIPNITPAKLDWSDLDLMTYLTQGFTPEFDTAGGHMVSVIENLARLPETDRAAIIAYLRKLPPVP